MSRPVHIWLMYALCFALVLGSMGWVSVTVLKLDDESADARQRAVLEENVRLALWRMDSRVAPLIGRENGRPYYAYSAFYPAQRAYTRMFSQVQPGDILVPSPLLTENNPEIYLHFQYADDGRLSSPQVPTGNMLDLAESGYTTHEKILQARARLSRLARILERKELRAALPVGKPEMPWVASAEPVPQSAEQQKQVQGRRNVQAQQALSSLDLRSRGNMTAQVANAPVLMNQMASAPDSLQIGMIQSIWIKDLLLLARRVRVEGREYLQGCWLDWEALQENLLKDVRALLPGARLERVEGQGETADSRRLASLPLSLIPGELSAGALDGFSPIQISLLIAWACVLLAAFAVGVLLRGTLALSERRGAFVSAVTHELRTPLTTFRMYTEMLAEGMVTDQDKRLSYLQTLQAEAERLDHLVQNVLAYARLERNRRGGEIQEISLADLTDNVRETLTTRAEQAGMQLVWEPGEAELAAVVRVDVSAVERVLFNLVDNASKYASDAEDRRIHLRAERAGGYLALRVVDHGAGLGPDVARRLFKPFSKSAKAAAESAPGVGLGLALSRRLALRMGGDLKSCPQGGSGACFELTLPLA